VSVNVRSLSKLSADLRRLPRVVAQKVTAAAAPVITDLGRKTFETGEDAYGVGWRPKDDGSKATLRKTGSLFKFVRYVAIGTKLRVALGVPYAKYQIGKRPIFPRQGEALPQAYSRALEKIAVDVVRAEMGR
jgi:hypothetical protein